VVTVLLFAATGRLDRLEAGDLLSMAANPALALLVGLFIQAIARQSERRREMIAELERARAENAALLARAREAAVLEERQRLAREIHDTLAQGLTGVVTQLEAAEAAIQDRPEAARGTWTRPVAWPARAWARPGSRCTPCAPGLWRRAGWWTPSPPWPGTGRGRAPCRRW
jgi:Histidine kinase